MNQQLAFRRIPALSVWVVLACLLASPPAAAAVDCELNGQHVNLDNGSTTAGKSGIVKCVDRETRKFVREEEYRNGRAIGHRKSVDFSGNTSVGTYNEQGNRDGEFKQYDANGALIADERYVNGDTTGVQTYYYPNKQVKRRVYSVPGKGALASIEYNDRGQLTQLRCADKPLLGDDRAPCGFDGRAADVSFHNSKGEIVAKARYDNGKRVSMTAYSAPGVISRSEDVQGDRRLERVNYPEGPVRLETISIGNRKERERELAKSGQPLRETRWQDGYKVEESLWYLNGQMKSRTYWQREAGEVLVKSEEFWDNGKIRARTVRDERRGYVGEQRTFNNAGVLETESTYDKGTLTRKKTWKNGALVSDEEYFEDGSRKSARKAD